MIISHIPTNTASGTDDYSDVDAATMTPCFFACTCGRTFGRRQHDHDSSHCVVSRSSIVSADCGTAGAWGFVVHQSVVDGRGVGANEAPALRRGWAGCWG